MLRPRVLQNQKPCIHTQATISDGGGTGDADHGDLGIDLNVIFKK